MTQYTIPSNQSKIEAAFWEFHRQNPDVYDELVALARDLKQRGYDQLGIGMLFEVLRWRRMRLTRSRKEKFLLNNNYRSYYSRLIMANCPDLDGTFNTRQLSVPHHEVP